MENTSEQNEKTQKEESNLITDDEKSNIENHSKLLYENALDSFQKKQYKKTITYIEKNETEFDEIYYWRTLFLKLTCYQEIIEKKISLYYNKEISLSSVSKYFTLFNKETSKFFIELRKDESDNKEYISKCECILTLILRQCYNYSQFCIHQKLLYDCIGFLSLGERLIMKTANFFKSPDSDYYASSIFLFLSSLFIISENYSTAKKYIIICLKLSYIELELRLDVNNTFSLINLSQFKESEQEKVNKIFFNIAICFFHLGVCYEHEYEIEFAYQAYKQAKWFSHTIPNDDLINFAASMYKMEKRELLRLKVIEFFKKEEKQVPEVKKQIISQPKLWFDEEYNLKKFEKLEQYISTMKLREVDDDDPDLLNEVHRKPFSKQVGVPTKTIHVLNYLMDEKFKGVIEKMKKLEINCLSKKTKDTIQKQILSIKNEQRLKDSEKAKEKKMKEEEEKKIKEEEEKKFKESEDDNFESQNHKINKEDEEKKVTESFKKKDLEIRIKRNKKRKLNLKGQITKSSNFGSSTNYTLISNKKYTITTLENKEEKNNEIKPYKSMDKGKSLSKTSINCSRHKNFIEKINYDHYIFNKSFKVKKKYLDEQFNRELKFQKNLLKCKGGGFAQLIDNFHFDEIKAKMKCEDFFEKTLENETKIAFEKNLKKEEQQKKSNIIERNSNMFRLPTKFMGRLLKQNKTIIPENENRKFIDNLTSQIEEIDNTKKFLLKSFKRNLKKNSKINV